MFRGELFTTGKLTAFHMTPLICSVFAFFILVSSVLKLLMTFAFLVLMNFNNFSFLPSSSAALPACRNGFIVATNGSTGEAYTCTPPH